MVSMMVPIGQGRIQLRPGNERIAASSCLDQGDTEAKR